MSVRESRERAGDNAKLMSSRESVTMRLKVAAEIVSARLFWPGGL